jgi:hypothetical protein
MSDIKIQPSATGSATVTLTAPATGTARTVTLPDSTDTLAVNSDVTNKLPLAGGTMTGTLNVNNTLPTIKLTDTNSGGYYSSVNQEGSSFKILADEGNVGSGQIRFYVGSGAEKVRILSSGGITFNGDTAAANALDDYEEGTWTPTLSGTSGGPSGVNFTSRLGWYTKIGRVVIADCRLAMSSWSSGPSGSALISGLPFNAPASSNYFVSPTIGYTHNFDADNAPKGGFVEEGSSVIRLIKANDSDARQVFSQNVSASALNGNETIFVSVAYIVSA